MTFYIKEVDLKDKENNFVPKTLATGVELFALHTAMGGVHRDRELAFWEAVSEPGIEVTRVDVFDQGRHPTLYEFLRGGILYVEGKRALIYLLLVAPDLILSISKARQIADVNKSVIWEKYSTAVTDGRD